MIADRYDAGIVGMVMMALDVMLAVEMRQVMPVVMAAAALAFRSAIVVMLFVAALDVKMQRPAHIQMHRGQDLKRHDQR